MAARTLRSTCQPTINGTAKPRLLERVVEQRCQTIARQGDPPLRDAQRFGPHTAKLLRAAKGTGLDARPSRDAGSYLCNYLSWRAIEAVNADNGPRVAAFIHIPPLARGGAVRRKGFPRVTLEELVDAGEAMLLEIVRLARRAD